MFLDRAPCHGIIWCLRWPCTIVYREAGAVFDQLDRTAFLHGLEDNYSLKNAERRLRIISRIQDKSRTPKANYFVLIAVGAITLLLKATFRTRALTSINTQSHNAKYRKECLSNGL